jgi:hypothetical protein
MSEQRSLPFPLRDRLWSALDWVAHALYVPTMLGRRTARARWHHHLHLIPAALLDVVCSAFDRRIGWRLDETWADLRPQCIDRLMRSATIVTERPMPHQCVQIGGMGIIKATCWCGRDVAPRNALSRSVSPDPDKKEG